MIKQLSSALELVADAPFGECFKHIMTASLHGVLRASKCRRDCCVLRAMNKERAERLAADIYGSELTLLKYILTSFGEHEYKTESKYSVKSVPLNEREDGNL